MTNTTTTPAPTAPIHSTYSEHGQSYGGETIFTAAGRKFRTKVHVDTSYSFQSHAKVEVWTEVGYQQVATLAAGEVTGPSAYDRNPGARAKRELAVLAHAERLLNVALAVVS